MKSFCQLKYLIDINLKALWLVMDHALVQQQLDGALERNIPDRRKTNNKETTSKNNIVLVDWMHQLTIIIIILNFQ